jgi:hypothetical protein
VAARKFVPSLHPRDRFGRFTRSRSAQATQAERDKAAKVATALKPKRGVTGAKAGTYLSSIASEQHREAVSAYTSGGYEPTHKALRAGKAGDASVRAMDAAMIELPDDLVVSRRVPLSAFAGTDPISLEGFKVKDAAYAPTAIGAVRATKNDMRMRIAIPKGTRAAVDPDTGEVILDRDLEMVVAKVEDNPAGGMDMWLTVLPKDRANGAPKPAKKTAPKKTAPAPADAEVDRPEGGDEVRADLMKLRVPELQARMRERGLKPGKLRKSQLVDALVADEMGNEGDGKAPDVSPAATPEKAPEPRDTVPPATLDEQIPTTISDLLARNGSRPTDVVSLARLRDELGDADRAEVDAALLRLDRARVIQLDSDPNRKALTARAKAAAIRLGGEDMHLVSLMQPIADEPAEARPVDDRIRQALDDFIASYGGKPGDIVMLSDIRKALPDVDRAQFDAAILRLNSDPHVHVIPESNQKVLTPEQRAGAVSIGNQPRHLIAITPSTGQTPSSSPPRQRKQAPDLESRYAAAAAGEAALAAAPRGLDRRDGGLEYDQAAGLREYRDGSVFTFKQINGALRDPRITRGKMLDSVIGGIDAAMAQSPLRSDAVTYRGVRQAHKMFGANRMAGDLTGLRWREDAFVSTSADENAVQWFTGGNEPNPVRMRILSPAGTNAVDLSDPDDPSEAELLLDRGHEFEVVADRGLDGNGVRSLDVQVLPKQPASSPAQSSSRRAGPKKIDPLTAAPVSLVQRGGSSLTQPQRDALNSYKRVGYTSINAALRRGDESGDDVQRIDEVMTSSKLTADVQVYRGVGSARMMFGERVSGDLTGLSWREDAFVSSTASEVTARKFSDAWSSRNGGLVMRIQAPAGTGGVVMSKSGYESELLLDRGHVYTVVADQGLVDGVRVVDVRVDPKPAVG